MNKDMVLITMPFYLTNQLITSIITNVMGPYLASTGIIELKPQAELFTLRINLNIAGNNYNYSTGYAFA